MPYWVSGGFEVGSRIMEDWSSIEGPRDFVHALGITALSPFIVALVVTFGDLNGEQGVHYNWTCQNLAQIPNLRRLTLQLGGVFKYTEWTQTTINNLREAAKEKLEPVTIEFVN
jgi:hypothetical protein